MPCAVKHHKTLKLILIKVPDMVILLIYSCKKPPKEKSSLAPDGRGCIQLESASGGGCPRQPLFHTHVTNFITICSQHQICWYRQSLMMQPKHHQSQQNPKLHHLTPWMRALSSGLLKKRDEFFRFFHCIEVDFMVCLLKPRIRK